jgi:hypothetical protein
MQPDSSDGIARGNDLEVFATRQRCAHEAREIQLAFVQSI